MSQSMITALPKNLYQKRTGASLLQFSLEKWLQMKISLIMSIPDCYKVVHSDIMSLSPNKQTISDTNIHSLCTVD